MAQFLSKKSYSTFPVEMPVTVKIKQEKKEKLNRCLASLLLREGVKISFQDALGLIIDYAFENEEA